MSGGSRLTEDAIVESSCSPGYVLCPTSDRGPVEWTTVAAKGAGSPSSAGFSSREKSTADADGGMCEALKPQRGGGAGSCRRGWWKSRPSTGREAYVSIYRALIPVGCPDLFRPPGPLRIDMVS